MANKTSFPTAQFQKHGAVLYQNSTDDGYDLLIQQGNAGEPVLSGGPDAPISIGKLGTDGIADGAVTTAKLAGDVLTTTVIADDAVTLAKLAHGTAGKVIGFDTNGVPAERDLPSTEIPDDAVTLAKLAHGTADKVVGFDATGAPAELTLPAPANDVKAWVHFNGTGAYTIDASHNVSSVTDLGVGQHLVNFITPMAHDNYVLLGSALDPGVRDGYIVFHPVGANSITTTSAKTRNMPTQSDFDHNMIAIIGG